MANTIPILDSFTSGRDGWPNYDTYDPVVREKIRNQRHVNLRNFPNTVQESWNEFASPLPIRAPRSGNGNIRSITVPFTSSGYDLSGSRNINGHFSGSIPIDIQTGFEDDDHFVVSFPNFALPVINTAASYIQLTSNVPSGSTGDPTKNLKVFLNQSLVPMVNGYSEFRVTLATLKAAAGVNFNFHTTGPITIHIAATGSGTLEINGIRMMTKEWESGGVGMDTLENTLRKMPRRDGLATTDFDQPILWRSSTPAGENDPRPIDANMVVPFSTGAAISGTSRISMYFREMTEDFLTQLDLNGMTMAELNGHDQPDVGTAKYNQREIRDLERFTIGELEGETIFSLERTPDSLSASWIEFTLQYGGGLNKVTIQDTEGNGYNFTFNPLSVSTNYAFCTFLEENKARAVLYALDTSGQYVSTVFDTTQIDDDTAFKRRKGRFGWFANFSDGDALVKAFAPNGVTYAEYRSLPYASQTPVVGAELFASNSPSIEFFEYFTPYSGIYASNPPLLKITDDTARSLSGSSHRFDIAGGFSYYNDVMFETQPFTISDYENAIIEFDAYVPDLTNLADGSAFLCWVEGTNFAEEYQLVVPPIVAGQWQHVKVNFAFNTPAVLPGEIRVRFQLNVYDTSFPFTFWIDNFSIKERTVVWDGRAVVDDPWNSNFAKWQPFRDNYSRDNGGIVFDRRGSNLQVRGRARKPTATINRVQYKPRYAELGKIASTDDRTSQQELNVVSNPSGTTNSTGWIGAGSPTSTTDAGEPALTQSLLSTTMNIQLDGTNGNTVLHQKDSRYFFGIEARRSAGSAAGTRLELRPLIYNPGGALIFQDTSSIVRAFTGDFGSAWTQYWIEWVPYGANKNLAEVIIPNSRIGFGFSVGFANTGPNQLFWRRATLVSIAGTPGQLKPFDGTTPGAQWTGLAPSQSQLSFNPWTSAITPTFSSSTAGLTATLTAAALKPVAIYEWNFGDGVRDTGASVVHTYPASGVYPVTLTARDRYGNQAIYSNTVSV